MSTTTTKPSAGVFAGSVERLDITPAQSRSWDEGDRAAVLDRARRKADRAGRPVQVLGRGRAVLATVEPELQPHQAAWDEVAALASDGGATDPEIVAVLGGFLGKLSRERLLLAVELLSTLSGRVTEEEP